MPHIWSGKGFLWLFYNRRKLSISEKRSRSTKPRMPFFMWQLWKTPLASESFPFSLYSADITRHSKPPCPRVTTGSCWCQSYNKPLLHLTSSTCHPHGWHRTHQTHSRRLVVLFEVASNGMSVDLEYNVEATHLTSAPIPPENGAGECCWPKSHKPRAQETFRVNRFSKTSQSFKSENNLNGVTGLCQCVWFGRAGWRANGRPKETFANRHIKFRCNFKICRSNLA